MRSELRVITPSWRVTITIGLTAAVVLITAMFVFRDEVRLILVGGAMMAGTVALIFVVGWYKSTVYLNRSRELDTRIKEEQYRLIRAEANKAELQSRFFVVSRNDRAVYAEADGIRIIDAVPQGVNGGGQLALPETIEQHRHLRDIRFIHMLIVGGTGSGKTTLMNHLIDERPADALIYALDPHSKFNQWSRRATIVGGNYDFQAINIFLTRVLAELNRRYTCDEVDFQEIVIVADEWLAIANHGDCPIAAKFFQKVGSEARKVRIHLILGTQSSTVKDLKIEGSGQARENFVQLSLSERMKDENVGLLKWGTGDTETVMLFGPYTASRRPSAFGNEAARLAVEEWGEIVDEQGELTKEEQDELFAELVERMSRRQAALKAYGKEYAGGIVTRGRRALGEID